MFGMDAEHADALPDDLAHRRGAGLNPGNRFETTRFFSDGDEMDRRAKLAQAAARSTAPSVAATGPGRGCGGDTLDAQPPTLEPVRVPLKLYNDRTVTVINRVAPTSDVPFQYTLNPYRGCEHGCIYCFARPYHEYLGFSSGLDFETKIVVKRDAPELLRRELANARWLGEPIVMSAITDVYQPIEHELELTRRCLEVLAGCGQPVTTMTKSALVLRDTDLWVKLAERGAGRVTVTLVTLDDALAKKLEPRAASPARRLRVIRELAAAGVPVSVNVAPVIPGLTDKEVPAILEAIAEAGATRAAWVMLRLPYQLKALFTDWLERNVEPARAEHVLSLLRQMHGGKLYNASKQTRRRGEGPVAEGVATMFKVFAAKHGLNRERTPLSSEHFRRPTLDGQARIFLIEVGVSAYRIES